MRSTPVIRRQLGAALAMLIAAIAVVPRQADAAATLSLTGTSGDPSVVVSERGGSFTVNVTLTTDEPFAGLTFFLSAPGTGSSQFSITGRTTAAGNPLSDPTSTNAAIVATPAAVLNPQNDADLGYTGDPATNIAAGTYAIGSLTLKTATSAPLVATPYTITVTRASLTNADFQDIPVTGGTYAVYAPEPATLAAVASLGAVAAVRRRRPSRS